MERFSVSTLRGFALVLSTFAFSGCASANVFDSGIDVFAKANTELASSVEEMMKTHRSRLRLDQLRGAVTSQIVFGDPLDSELDLALFACGPRGAYARVATSKTYLASVAADLSDRSGEPSNDLLPLVASLFSDYAVDIDQPPSQQAVSDAVAVPCQEDIKGFPSVAYGLGDSRTESGVFTAALGLLEVLKNVLLPVIETGLQEVDRARRTAAIRDFLTDERNRSALEESITALDQFLIQELTYSRQMAMFELSENLDRFVRTSKKKDQISECDELGQLPDDENAAIQMTEFQRCHRALWESWQEGASKLVKAAAAYDLEADKTLGNSVQGLKKSLDRLGNIANGELGADEFGVLFAAMVRLADLGKKIEEAASVENREKIVDAVDALFEEF